MIDQCLAACPKGDPRQKIFYGLRRFLQLSAATQQQREQNRRNSAKSLPSLPRRRIASATLVALPAAGMARIVAGGAEDYANVDPRVPPAEGLKIGAQILVDEAYAVIKALGYDHTSSVLRVVEACRTAACVLSRSLEGKR